MLLLGSLGLLALGCDDGGPASADAGGHASLYPQVHAILERSCAFERCHQGRVFGGGLYLDPDADMRAALVGVPACEYERMARVEPFDPAASWLMVKLTATFRPETDPYANYIEFTPASNWQEGARGCPDQTEDGHPLFGQRMPALAPNRLPDTELSLIEAWIAQGAPP